MKHRETLDEAIDRVAMRMTRSGDADRVEIDSVRLTTSPAFAWTLWGGRLLAGVAGVAAVALAVVMLRTPRVDEPRSVPPVDASGLVAWSPFPRGVGASGPTSASGRSGRPLSRPVRAALKGGPYDFARRFEAGASPETGTRPAWGIPFIDAPAALAVPAPTVAQLEIDAVAVEAIEIEPLMMSPIDAGVPDAEAFDFAQAKEQ